MIVMKKNNFEKLFGDTYIGKNKTKDEMDIIY